MSIFPKITRYGADPLVDPELATKKYVDDHSGASPLTTKGDVFGFSTVDARIAIGSNDQVLTADSAQALGLKWATPAGGGNTFARVVKKAIETVSSDNVLHDDNEILIALLASKTYHFESRLHVASDATSDFKYAWTIPTGATGFALKEGANWRAAGNFGQDEITITTVTNHAPPWTENQVLMQTGRIIMSSTAGNLQLQWAQKNSNASDTSVLQGSSITVIEEIA